jgi:hypothetical protein
MQSDEMVEMQMAYEKIYRFIRLYIVSGFIESEPGVENNVLLGGLDQHAGGAPRSAIPPSVSA